MASTDARTSCFYARRSLEPGLDWSSTKMVQSVCCCPVCSTMRAALPVMPPGV